MKGVHLSSQGGAFLPQQGQEGQLQRKGPFPFQEHQLQAWIVVLAELVNAKIKVSQKQSKRS